MNQFLWSVIEKNPLLEKIVYVVSSQLIRTKYQILACLQLRFGYIPKYLSSKGQDRWVIEDVFKYQTNLFFLELGAYDGFTDSNSYILEKRYNWRGICIETIPEYYERMRKTFKRSCICLNACIDEKNDTPVDLIVNKDRSGIIAHDTDNNASLREKAIMQAKRSKKTLTLRTMTLYDLLRENNAPRIIDYFSLDVEGAETRILRNFPFDKYTFLALTIERPSQELNQILFRNGYVFIKNNLFDSFYLHKSFDRISEIRKEAFVQINSKRF